MKRLSAFFSSKPSIDIAFSGDSGSGKEAEDFVQAVRKYAFDRGKQNDNQWTAQFASTCFTGSALRWYEGLPGTVQADWRFLRHALLNRYPAAASTGGGTLNTTIPTPAAAPPAWLSSQSVSATPPASATGPSSVGAVSNPSAPYNTAVVPPSQPIAVAPPSQPITIPPLVGPMPALPPKIQNLAPTGDQAVGMRTGRIEVVVPGWPSGSAFVSKTLDNGCFKVGMLSKSMALRVRYFPKTGDIYLNNSDAAYSCLGLTWSLRKPDLRSSSSDSAQITAVSAKYAWSPSRTSSPWHGDIWGPIWKVAYDGQLLPQELGPIGARRRSLDVVVYVGDDSLRLYVVSSFDSFVSWVGEGYTLAKLMFTES